MKRNLKMFLALTTFAAALAWAGGMYLEIGSPSANAEATALNAVLVARVTACHEPAKSVVTAHWVESSGAGIRRTELKVVPLKTAGMFAVVGAVPKGGMIDLAVTNPEYNDYRPRVFVRNEDKGVQWTSVKRFFSKPPTDADTQSFLQKSE